MTEDCFVVRFDITNEELFEPERRKLCQALGTGGAVPGAKVTAVSSEDVFQDERYIGYLWSCIDNRQLEPEHIMDQEEWENNGRPKRHDETADYKYTEEYE